ncbi:uncharacterized protein KGF55_000190 [Candida pseudojiufengensis]|uniref:uncharacterized protein n=1 Tax=Candida pseudojiufengensis TaxID=497109 RepID=UPI002224F754|nr:uncharacterized protein KGF55_000190 [Candida pseudojiufengensis]KAI5966781.1 hypothetical protein KGF55_000190 [Candida pseudojiufengensis]
MSLLTALGLNTRVPYHFLFYSLSFGGSAFYSYIVSPLIFKNLTREEFSKVQSKVFPTYFKFQILSPFILGLLTPFAYCPFSVGTLAISSITGMLNLFFFEPKCHAIKEERIKLVAIKKDKKDNGIEPSDAMAALNSQFGRWHGLSTLINTLSIVSLGAYGLFLAKFLTFIRY